ncbi:PadR-like family transcriptional regulator [Enterococcus sp. 10A9_DIV0425]|uniref:PadR-like family transcriptional regulator n=1 Tax=Candidatus Enterococcus wittei TaxID=1987383 RepID=A0A242K2D5_9ENTE|nr:PadR family transcriptional regulator [Enterococcus sp. 10A9_DIV0425]OTP11206.1 PadR-like family transcriptional regulator [Enterococcus sp. 10A9_DIV0425]THE15759.1 PadR family transcriptional regulator [Enterococcus hirae]
MKNMTEMFKGVLEGIVLEIISNKETYGYEITRTLQELGFEEIVEGTVYTILIRLEKKELVTVEKKKSDLGPMRKFYRLNERGEEERKEFWERWDFFSGKLEELKENFAKENKND